jgi:X-Pro dipeptidyl-peptidase (S15 family)
MKNIVVVIILLGLLGCSETKNEKNKTYATGFKVIQTKDLSRIYKPNTDTTDYLHFRPLDIDIWYPATASEKDNTVLLRKILGLLEQRANYYTASTAGNGITGQIAQYFCDALKCADSTSVLNFKTQSIKNAIPATGKFPLVIYLAAFNGMSYENVDLFEALAKKGFVVVSVSSIGRFPGDMTMKNGDLLEQVKDAVASVDKLKNETTIDFTKIGIVGYSWGGLAGAILAGKIPTAACFISLDGSEFHHYGAAKEENADFDSIRYSHDFNTMQISVPYLRLESSPPLNTEKEDSVYNFSEKLTGSKQLFKIDSAQHEDFGCMPLIVKASGNCKSSDYYKTISKLTISFLEEYLKNENHFSNTVAEEMNRTIHKK